ncbi:sodium:solute symporter family protein [Metallumcola ferriviriculae]|uniref:Sodium:solute symporter family protein n=1 Tax=Metallumcola ferriviriculae TaxID=3039180 RepID=A0AAU0UNS3_9FIRM|nr:sodium:solute symporter family protein [Desulfitibacteraceae bacterium MK1]
MNLALLWILVVIYLGITGILGYMGYSRTKEDKDYLIAGGDVNPFVLAMSYGATFISTSAIVGFGGVAGLFGMSLLWLTFFNIFVGIFIAFVFFGKRTLLMGRALGSYTLAEFLGQRYQSRFIRGFVASQVFIILPVYAAAVLIGGARFMEGVLSVDYAVAVMVLSGIVAAYVMWGGLRGVVYTDAFQAVLMFIFMLIMLITTYVKLGGIVPAHQALTNLASMVPDSLKAGGHQGWTAMPKFGSPLWWTQVSTIILGVGIGVLAQPQLVVRYLTVRSPKQMNRAVLMGGIFIFMMTGVAFIVGPLSNVWFVQETGKIAIASVANGNVDLIIPAFLKSIMPQWFSYLFLLAMLAAAMSTLSSQFHVQGVSLTHDIFGAFYGPGRKLKNSLLINRLGILVALVAVVWLSFVLPPGIIAIATAFFFGTCAVTFLPIYVGALYWKGATRSGAVASMVSGAVVVTFLLLFVHAKEAAAVGLVQALLGRPALLGFPWTVVDPLIIGLPISTAVFIGVSLVTQPIKEEHVERCFHDLEDGKSSLPGETINA